MISVYGEVSSQLNIPVQVGSRNHYHPQWGCTYLFICMTAFRLQ